MATTHADTHDLEKMERWHQGLKGEIEIRFPVCAIFLASGDDQLSHDIFRKFRKSFEKRDAGFHHLIIFGQHGISTAVIGFLEYLDLPLGSLPYLSIASDVRAREITLFKLPPGGHPGPAPALTRDKNLEKPWQMILDRVESAVDTGSTSVDLAGISGESTVSLNEKSLTGLVESLLKMA